MLIYGLFPPEEKAKKKKGLKSCTENGIINSACWCEKTETNHKGTRAPNSIKRVWEVRAIKNDWHTCTTGCGDTDATITSGVSEVNFTEIKVKTDK